MITIENRRKVLFQWDQGQRLVIEGYPVGTAVHFATRRKSDTPALVVTAYEEEGKIYADIPNVLLQTAGDLHIYIYTENGNEAHTEARFILAVVPREKPDDYVYTETEVKRWEDFEERITALEHGGGLSLFTAEEDIPKVFFGGPLQKTKDEAVVSFRYVSKTQDISGYAEIKAQGDSSMLYPKKNQTVKLFKDAECTEKLKMDFRGWGEQNKFCFKANWIDLSHARNIVSARLWGDVVKSRANYDELPELLRTSPNLGAVDGFPVKVYADGVYQGRYTINIPKDKWMANMDDELETHCILCSEGYGSSCFRASAKISGDDWSDEVHDTVPDAIKTRWNEVIDFVRNSTDEAFVSDLGNYFDVLSLIDYYLFGLAICHLDGFGKNQLYLTYDGVKWIADAYDMDSTWGLYWNGLGFVSAEYARTQYEDYVNDDGNLLYVRLENLFMDAIKARWNELKNGALSMDNIINRFERFTDICPAELVQEDFASTTAEGAYTGIPSQSSNNIQQIRNYARKRHIYVEELINPILCTAITLSASELTFTGLGEQTLTATVEPLNTTEEITWECDNTDVVTVSNGKIITVGDGEAVITVRCGSQSAICNVYVSGTAEGAMYPLVDGSKTFSDGITLEISNGNHVKVSSTGWKQSLYLNLSNIDANGDKAVSADNAAYNGAWFELPGNSTVKFTKSNTTYSNATSFNANCLLAREDGTSLILYPLQKLNDDLSKTTSGVSGGNVGPLYLVVQGIDAGDTVEFDVELLVNGIRYI